MTAERLALVKEYARARRTEDFARFVLTNLREDSQLLSLLAFRLGVT